MKNILSNLIYKAIIALLLIFLSTPLKSWAEPALVDAVKAGNIKKVKELINSGVDINEKDYGIVKLSGLTLPAVGETALIWAADERRYDMVKLLIDAGADVNIISDKGYTALAKACMRNELKIVKLLIDAGAKPDYVALSFSVHDFAKFKMLIEAGANATEKYYGQTHIMNALAGDNPNIEVIKALIAMGVDVNSRNRYGFTALSPIFTENNAEIIKILKQAGAKQ